MSPPSDRRLFLGRQAYRRQRMIDATRMVPVAFAILVVVPPLWRPAAFSFASGVLWLGGGWLATIAITAALNSAIGRTPPDPDPDHDPNPGPAAGPGPGAPRPEPAQSQIPAPGSGAPPLPASPQEAPAGPPGPDRTDRDTFRHGAPLAVSRPAAAPSPGLSPAGPTPAGPPSAEGLA